MEKFPDGQKQTQEREKKPVRVKTARGSVYTYLSDGRTQRYKEATGVLEEPMDILVFIPPWDVIGSEAKKRYPEIFSEVGGDAQFTQDLLQYVQGPEKTIRVGDAQGNVLSDMNNSGQLYLYFITRKDGKMHVDFTLPVSREPKIGYSTFDYRENRDEKNMTRPERHIGNKVVEIING